jgi:MFS family permease/flagellar motor switch/type III secretory pathway protein FliN
LPFAFGYFLSYLFRTINPLIAKGVMADLAIGQSTFAAITAVFFFVFAVSQLVLGAALDRFGPRTIQAALMAAAALGAAISSVATDVFGLLVGRTLIGLGLSSALMSGLKANTMWFPRERLGLVNGCLIAVGGLGALTGTYPTEYIVHVFGWRALLGGLSVAAALCPMLVLLLVPSAPIVRHRKRVRDEGLGLILRDPLFLRVAPLDALAIGTAMAVQTLWAGQWLAAVDGLDRGAVVAHLSVMAVGLTVGAFGFGLLNDWARRAGRSPSNVLAAAVVVFLCVQMAVITRLPIPTYVIWGVFSLFSSLNVLSYSNLTQHFPEGYAGRATTCMSALQLLAAFAVQSGIGFLLDMWSSGASGGSPASAYQMAFAAPIALQLLALAWYVLRRSAAPRGAQHIAQVQQRERSPHVPPIARPLSFDATLTARLCANHVEPLRATIAVPFGVTLSQVARPVPEAVRPNAQEMPLPVIAPEHVRALNAFLRPRPAVAMMIAGRRLTVTAAYPSADKRSSMTHEVQLRIAGETGKVRLPGSLLDLLVASADPDLSADRLAPEAMTMVLGLALSNAIEAAEASLGDEITIVAISSQRDEPPAAREVALPFRLAIDGFGSAACELRVAPGLAMKVAQRLDQCSGADRTRPDLPVPICLRAAAALITRGEFERLSLGDVVFVGPHRLPANIVVAVIGEHLVAPVELTSRGSRLLARPMPRHESPWAWSVARANGASPSPRAHINGEDEPLRMIFELGRFELPLKEIRRLAPNMLLPGPTSLKEALDLVVDGQRVGCGVMDRIGDQICVRITRLSGHTGRRAAPSSDRHLRRPDRKGFPILAKSAAMWHS